MKFTYRSIVALAVALTVVSCGKSESPLVPNVPNNPSSGGNKGVEVTISTASIQTKQATLEFTSSAKMNIFAKTYQQASAPNIVDNVVATLEGNTWTMTPKVMINESQKNAFVYAVSPYDPSYTDIQKIPVDLKKQVDLMYSGSYVPASLTSPAVKLTMKHALSLLSFNIVPVGYTGAGNLTSITICGEKFNTTAELDGSQSTVKITNLGGANVPIEGKFSKKVAEGGWRSDLPGIWSLPFEDKVGSVKFTAVIDGRTFETVLPEVEVKTGWQYIFRLALTNNGLEFDPSKTQSLSLNVTTDEAQTFNGFGRISLKAKDTWLNSPILAGEGVFGTLVTPQKSQSYTTSVKVEGLSAGQNVILDSWNTTGFTLPTLDGVDVIDISEYE